MFKTSTAYACNLRAKPLQLLLVVVTRSRELSRECHVTKHKTPARSNFQTIQFSSSSSTSRGLCPKNFKKGRTLLAKKSFMTALNFNSPVHAFVLIINKWSTKVTVLNTQNPYLMNIKYLTLKSFI